MVWYPAGMDFSATTLIAVFDRVGIVAFAFSGVELGLRRRLDLFGLIVLGVVTATGGGVLRDVLLQRVPLLFVRNDYLLLAAGSALVAILLLRQDSRGLRAALWLTSSLGLGAFAVTGALAGLEADLGLPAVIVLAILTATGGGVVRDLLAARVPMVLRTEVNATAAALAAIAVWVIEPRSAGAAALAGVGVVVAVRAASRALGFGLPVPGGPAAPPGTSAPDGSDRM